MGATTTKDDLFVFRKNMQEIKKLTEGSYRSYYHYIFSTACSTYLHRDRNDKAFFSSISAIR